MASSSKRDTHKIRTDNGVYRTVLQHIFEELLIVHSKGFVINFANIVKLLTGRLMSELTIGTGYI